MIVSIIFNTEYMKVEERIKWFLKSASYAKKQDVVIVTHEYIKMHLREMIEKLGERFYDDFEMDHLTVEEAEKLEICYVPDSYFEEIYNRKGAQTRALTELSFERNQDIEDYMMRFINDALLKRGLSAPDYIQCCLHSFASVRFIAEYYQCPLLPYVFSAIRKVHGYTQTLYMAHFDRDLLGVDAAKKLYDNYLEDRIDFKLFTKKEIMCLLGKTQNLPLIPYIDYTGKYEMGVMVEAFQLTPQTYKYDEITDDDLYFEANRWYRKEQIKTRVHPLKMDRFGITRAHMKNDPSSFLISCKRFCTVQSQMITKAAMWNRVPCVIGDALPFGFLFSNDFRSKEAMSDEKLNFLLFCYFVPDVLMFDANYWIWRKKCPKPIDVMKRHLFAIFEQLGYDNSLLYSNQNRCEAFLLARGFNKDEITQILKKCDESLMTEECLSSMIEVSYQDGQSEKKYCRNERYGADLIASRFFFRKNVRHVKTYLFNDVDGYYRIVDLIVNGHPIEHKVDELYSPKGSSQITLDYADGINTIEVIWKSRLCE